MILVKFINSVRVGNKIVSFVQVNLNEIKISGSTVTIKNNIAATIVPLSNIEYIFAEDGELSAK